jgi:hypothetical protein
MRLVAYVIGAVLFALIGCAKSDTVPVTGTVVLNGQPAENAEVMFNPKGAGRMATGYTDASGRFKLSTAKPNDGAAPGEYVVTLGEHYTDKAPPLPPLGQSLPMRFPQQYGDPAKSPLTANIERGKTNDFKFDVKK